MTSQILLKQTRVRYVRKMSGVPRKEVVVFTPTDKTFIDMRKKWSHDKLRRIVPHLYTTNLKDSMEDITRRNLFFILGFLYPQGVISHRSAFEFDAIMESEDIFVTYSFTKTVAIPGYTVHLMEGPGGGLHDKAIGNLFVSCEERSMLEVLQKTRFGLSVCKGYTPRDIKRYLKRKLAEQGEKKFLAFRDRTCEVAEELAMMKEFDTLNDMITAIITNYENKQV